MDVTPYTEDLDLASVNAWEDLSRLLVTLHLRADKPSLRTLEARSRHGTTPLSKTVVSEMLRGTRFPRKAVMLAFLEACGIRDRRAEPWLRAWERIAEQTTERRVRGTAATGLGQPAGGPGASGGGTPADSAETTLLREQVSKLSADNKWLRTQIVASKAPAAADMIRSDDDGGDRATPSPQASRRELGFLLRALREDRKITVDQAADRLLCSPGKIKGMESSFRAGTPRDVRDLCDLYGVTEEPRRRHLMQLARESGQQGWWQSYGNPEYSTYIDFENDATSIRVYHSAVVPGLLQSVEYARALHQRTPYNLSPKRIDQLIEVRLIRQRILTRVDPPNFWAILDEAALHRSVGGPVAMREQLERIVELSKLHNVVVQVIPFDVGAHAAMDSSFTILEFNDPVPAMVYAEGLSGSLYLEKPKEVEEHRRVFELLRKAALNEQESVRLIAQMLGASENRA